MSGNYFSGSRRECSVKFRVRLYGAVPVLAALLMAGGRAATYDLPLAWDASPTPLVAYRVHVSTNGTPFATRLTTTNLTANMTFLPMGTNRINVTAFDPSTGLESLPSNTLTSVVALPVQPFNLRVNGPLIINVQ